MLVVGIVVRDQEEICAIKLCPLTGKVVCLIDLGEACRASTVKKTLSQTCHQVMSRVFGIIYIIICMKRYYYGLPQSSTVPCRTFVYNGIQKNSLTHLYNCCI